MSEPSIFHKSIREALPKKVSTPEQVNFREPPAVLLGKLYEKHFDRAYRKPIDGENLFQKLTPDTAAAKCPHLKLLLDDLLALASPA